MKKHILLFFLVLSSLFSKAVPYFGELGGTSGCIEFNSTTGKLTLNVTYGLSDWIHHAYSPGPPTSTTWAYIKNPSSAGYFGPYLVTSVDPGTRTNGYDITPLLSQIQPSGCHDFFIVSDASIGPLRGTLTPPPTIDPLDGCHPASTHYISACNCCWDVSYVWNACPCPTSDSIPPCFSEFRMELTGYSTYPLPSGFFGKPNNTVEIWPLQNHPSSTYVVDWGDLGPTSPTWMVSHVYPVPGSYTICLKETTALGDVCTSCITFCTSTPGGGSPSGGSEMMKKTNIINSDLKSDVIELYPNPSTEKVEIRFNLNKKEKVEVLITDIVGKKITALSNSEYKEGSNSIAINTSDFAPGVYNVQIKIGNIVKTKKLTVSKN